MYTAYFQLNENPFSLTPDPIYLFMSKGHQEALAHLLYGMQGKAGFAYLTGEVGTGKTTICRSLLEQADDKIDIALVLNPKQTAIEIVASICDELHIKYDQSRISLKNLIDLLNRYLLKSYAKGRKTTLIIDEAQNLSSDVLEQLRLLTNLETTTNKLLQILLIGQPELQELMNRRDLRQLSQRITARYHLAPLVFKESTDYIEHRLMVAGCKRNLFTKGALRLIHRNSQGIPRLINLICDRALLGAYVQQKEKVNRVIVRRASREIFSKPHFLKKIRQRKWAIIGLFFVLFGIGWLLFLRQDISKWVLAANRYQTTPISTDIIQNSHKIVRMKINPPLDLYRTQDKIIKIKTDKKENLDIIPLKTNTETDIPINSKEDFSLSSFLQNKDIKTDRVTAFKTLFRYWDQSYSRLEGKTACQKASNADLQCLFTRGNWTTIRQYNRPLVLELLDNKRNKHSVVVSQFQNWNIMLDFSGKLINLHYTEIEPYWYGDFILFWKPPPDGSTALRLGDRSDDVLWLKQALNYLNEPSIEKNNITSPLFDKGLKNQIIRFQKKHNLKSDGIVGVKTLIKIRTLSEDRAIPYLWKEKEYSLLETAKIH